MSSRKTLALVDAVACVVALCFVSPGVASAAVWNSVGEADWTTASNWDTGVAPKVNSGDTATLLSGTASYAGPADFQLVGGPMTLSGGSFKTTPALNVWVAWGGKDATGGNKSNLTVNSNSTFDFNSATQLFIGGGSSSGVVKANWAGSVNVNGGNLNGKAIYLTDDSTLNITSGNVTLSGLLHVRDGSITMSGGTLSAIQLSLEGVNTVVTLTGGQMNLTYGVYNLDAASRYIDFAGPATGVVHVLSDPAGASAANLLSSGNVRNNGIIDAAAFTITTDGTGSYIQAVPEPTSGVILATFALVPALLRRRRQRN